MGPTPTQLRHRDYAVVGCLLVLFFAVILALAFYAGRDQFGDTGPSPSAAGTLTA